MLARDITEQDIPLMIDYWFNPDHQRYHEKRGAFGQAQVALLQNQEEIYKGQIETPIKERNYTTIILEKDLRQVAQVHLNDIRDDMTRRIHFHPWFKSLPNKSFGQAVRFWREAIPVSMNYFFSTYPISEIIGDVSVNNKIANFCLKKIGCISREVVQATYLGDEGLYNRYRFFP